jgi:two-component system sensor histidine kinase KdpD
LDVRGDLPIVIGEETYVEQVVRNLLTNAAKYSDPPTPIGVVAEAVGQEVVVRVLDEGIGIDTADAERAFDLFYRARSVTKVASGAGIGLFVCRQLVRAMGGRIWIEPRPSGGTEVGFALPAHPDEDLDAG